VSIIDSNHVSCTFSIPFSTNYIGNYILTVDFNTSEYTLSSAFTVTAFNAGITGKVYYDANANGVYDAGDTTLSNSKVELTPGNNLAYTNNSGNYGFGTVNGNYTVTYLPRYYETVTTAASFNVTINSNIQVRDFGVQITPTFDSLSLYIWHWLFRCNTPQSVYAYIVNNGGSPAKGRLVMIQDPAMGTIATTPPPDYYSNDTLYWNFASLPTGQTFTVLPTFTAPAAGTPLNFKFIAQQLDAGNNVIFSEEQDFSEIVSCSFDPNDKRAQPPGVQAPHYTLFGDDLYYTIRFQNTGNDTAFRVIILDTLDADLDYSTFEFITSTHPCTTELNPANGALKFTFKNILLPDSNTNEPASHGEVTYRIKTQTGLAANTVINNTAYIVFDLNTPVVTDTTLNTMVYIIPVGIAEAESSGNGVVIYPNPFDHSAWLTFSNDSREKFTLTITDPGGRKVFEKEISSGRYLIEKGNLKEGMYFYELSNKNRTINYSGKFAVR
ncbi:MAG: SdrD B-like domain-containing protein, partial [Bacteroidota bacterium]